MSEIRIPNAWIAERLEIDVANVSRWRSGFSLPSFATQCRIDTAYGYDIGRQARAIRAGNWPVEFERAVRVYHEPELPNA